MISRNSIHMGDCLEIMPGIEEKSIDLVLADLPYGTTLCSWDTVIPFEPLWREYRRVLKPKGILIFTACQPFTTDLINSNRKWFRYELIWNKVSPVGFNDAKKKPLAVHENILIFSPVGRGSHTYNPKKTTRDDVRKIKAGKLRKSVYKTTQRAPGEYTDRYPTSIITVSNAVKGGMHPTQKPVELFQYLIETYSNPGDLVLDNTAGSGTTGVACVASGRDFILIEKDPEIFDIMKKRMDPRNWQFYRVGQFGSAPVKKEGHRSLFKEN